MRISISILSGPRLCGLLLSGCLLVAAMGATSAAPKTPPTTPTTPAKATTPVSAVKQVKVSLIKGLAAGSIPDGESGWKRWPADSGTGDNPSWSVTYEIPDGATPYVQVWAYVWGNGPRSQGFLREIPEVNGELTTWTLSADIFYDGFWENNLTMQVLDEDNKPIVKVVRDNCQHQGRCAFLVNGVPFLPGTKEMPADPAKKSELNPEGKIADNTEAWKWGQGAWMPFSIMVSKRTPEQLRKLGVAEEDLEFGDVSDVYATVTWGNKSLGVPVSGGNWRMPKYLRVSNDWNNPNTDGFATLRFAKLRFVGDLP